MNSATTAQSSSDRFWRRRGAVLRVLHVRAVEEDGRRRDIVIVGSIPNRSDDPAWQLFRTGRRFDEEAALQPIDLNTAP